MADYSALDRLLHRLALGSAARGEMLHDIERSLYLKSAPADGGRHIFVTGLARAGTTILMREIYGSGEFGSLTYADMPFVLAPNLWSRMSSGGRKTGPKTERAHGDGIEVDFQSPEALDEVFWRVFSGCDYIRQDYLLPHKPDAELVEGYRDFIRLILRRTGKVRYLSKNNNNLLRLASLAKIFPDAFFLIPLRAPLDHADSLLNQHRRFLKSDAFTRSYMGWLAHHEFGATHRPIAWAGRGIGANIPFDPLSLDYWLGQWIAAHREIERIAGVYANVQIVPGNALTGDATIWPVLAHRIGVKPEPLREIRTMPDREHGGSQCQLAQEANELYRRLEEHGLQSLRAS